MKYILYILCLLTTIFLITVFFILYQGFSDHIQKSDVAVILGTKVRANGILSGRLRARLDKGIELYKKGIVNNIIVSGGTGKEKVNEAVAMQSYLLSQGIPATAIVMDKHGHNTAATAKNTLAIMNKRGFKSVIVVSQYFHIARARLAFQQCGIDPIYSAHANYFEWRDFYSTTREVMAYYDYLLFNNCH